MMDSAFHLLGTIQHFLFEGWSASTAAGFAGVCISVAICAFLIEILKLTKTVLWRACARSPLAAAPPGEINSRPEIVQDLMIPSSVANIRRKKIQIHIGLTFLHVVELVSAYMLMLAVMTYNGYIAITAVTASGLSYYFLGPLRVSTHFNKNGRHTLHDDSSEGTTTSHLLEDETVGVSINGTSVILPPHQPTSDNVEEESTHRVSADVHM